MLVPPRRSLMRYHIRPIRCVTVTNATDIIPDSGLIAGWISFGCAVGELLLLGKASGRMRL